ncbi:MAG: helicase HerA domain-containing protein, partial [Kineosporiaceae bacterium]
MTEWRSALADCQMITGVPRADGDDADRRTRAALAAAVVAAHGALVGVPRPPGGRGRLVLSWLRRPAEERIRVVVAGVPTSPPGRQGGRVLWPPGALSEPVAASDVTEWWQEHPYWVRCAGGDQVPAWGESGGDARVTSLDAMADWDHVVTLGRPFGWVVVAEPIPSDRLEAEIVRWRTHLGLLRAKATSESHQVDLERGRRRFRELVTARAGGLWDVHVLAGGLSPADARLVASLLSHAVSAQPSPLVLVPDSHAGPLDEAWRRTVAGPDGTTSPFTAGGETVARLAPPPSREVPGVRSLVPPRFDLTPEVSGDIVLGRVVDETFHDVGAFGVTPETVNRHVFVCGATGSGKSQTTRQLLESLARADPPVPWLVVEPVKAEYAAT